MPPKSKATKSDETVTEPEVSKTEDKSSDVASVPSWRAEVVEEGVEDKTEEKQKDETQETPAPQTEEKPKEKEEEVADLTNETASTVGETPEAPASSWTEESSLTPPSDNTVKISLSKKLFWLFLFLIVGGLLVGGFFYYKSKVGGEPTSGTTGTLQVTSAPEATATPTPSEETKLDGLKVNILNGSGIPGEAGKVQALLEEAGFADFKTGNAGNYNYTITEVTLKKGVSSAAFDAVKEALDEYNVVKQEDTLDEDSDFDVEIIVGTKEAAASPAPSQ